MNELSEHAGSWTGTNDFRLMPGDDPFSAPALAAVRVDALGHVTSITYSWIHPEDGPQAGFAAIGVDDDPQQVVVFWADSWHQSPASKVLSGIGVNGKVVVGYSYGGDWRWQITIDASAPDALTLLMDNVVPESAATDIMRAGPYPAMVASFLRSV
jgi:hypothetical protein